MTQQILNIDPKMRVVIDSIEGVITHRFYNQTSLRGVIKVSDGVIISQIHLGK